MMPKHLRRVLRDPPTAPKVVQTLTVGEGNLIGTFNSTDYYGVKGLASNGIEEVPSAAPDAIDTVYSDGLTAARTEGGILVWLATKLYLDTDNDGTADTSFADTNATIRKDARIIVKLSYHVPITGGGGTTARVYLPYLIA